MRRFSLTRSLALVVLLLLPALAAAQETTGSIAGTVVQKSGGAAIPTARITVKSERGTRELTTDGAGRFLLAFLTPGTYGITIAADGFGTIEDSGISVGLGQRISRRYELSPVMEESMDVVAPAEQSNPVIDLTVQSTGASITSELAEQLPIPRNISDLVFLAPGVKSGGGTGSANPSMSGSSGLENQYVVNGVNVTNGGYGALGAYSIIHGSQGTGINFNFVKETQVITGGFAAEYGQAMGGIVNIVTKTGSNEWDGSLFGYLTPDAFETSRATPDLESLDIGPTLGLSRIDYGFDIGGPIVKDHVFFWAGINPTTVETTRRAPFRDRDGDGVSDYLLYEEGALKRTDETVNWAADITFQINPDHVIDVSAFGDPTKTNNTYTRTHPDTTLMSDSKEQFSAIDFGYKNYSIKYQGQVTPKFLLELQLARADNTFSETFAEEFDINRNTNSVPLQLQTGPLGIAGGIGYFENNESINDQMSAKFTSIFGKHEIRYGITSESVDYNATTDRTGPGYVNRNGEQTTTGISVSRRLDCNLDATDPRVTATEFTNFCDDTLPPRDVAVIYRVVRGLLSDPVKATHSDYTAVYLQDDWSITPDFHLNFGLRWEKQSIEGSEIKYTFPGEFSPRVGFSWDHTGVGKAKIYGHAGRFYEKVPLDMAVRIFSPEVGISRDDHFDPALNTPIPAGSGPGARYIEQTSAVSGVVPGTRNSYIDEIAVGYQRSLGKEGRWTAKGELQFRNIGRILEDFDVSVEPGICDELEAGTRQIEGWGDVAALLRPGSDQLFTDANDEPYAVDCGYLMANVRAADINGVTTDGNIVDPERKYKSATFEFTRNADERWFMTLQYVLSRVEGNYEGLYRNDNEQSDPNLTSLYDFANEPAFYDSYKSGPLNTDRTHRFQAFGYYNWQKGWFFNSRFVFQTGIPKLALAAHPIYENSGEIQISPRGSLGRTPSEWSVDVGFGRKFKLKTTFDSTLTVSADVFNLFNHTYGNTFDFDIDSGTQLGYADYPTFVASVADGIPNPDHGKATTFSPPRSVRLGVKWTF